MSVEENKALVRRFLEEQAKGNLDVIDELLSPDFLDRGLVPGQGPTREDFKRSIAEILDAFSIISLRSKSRSPKVTRSSPSTRREALFEASGLACRPRERWRTSMASTSTAFPTARLSRSGARRTR